MTTEIEKLERRWQENPLGLTFAPLAEAYRKTGSVSRALELLDTGLAQHPGYVPAHIVRGRCHLDSGERALAELDFLCVAELDPENVIALKALADLAEEEGRTSDAIQRLESLLDIDRNNEEAEFQLERLRAEQLPTTSAIDPTATEFVPRDDATSLQPSNQRIDGIEVMEIDLQLPGTQADEPVLDALPDELAVDSSDVKVVEFVAPPVEAVVEPIAVIDSVAVSPEKEAERQPEPDLAPLPEPEPRRLADLPDELTAWLADPIPEPVVEPEARSDEFVIFDEQAEPDSEIAAVPESMRDELSSELVVTETMAEIFLRQGHRELALAVYHQLLQREPGNERIAGAAAELSASLAPPPAPVVEEPAPPPPPRFDAQSTGGRSVKELFSAVLSAGRPRPAAAVHPPAFDRAESKAPSFDEFFATEEPAGPASTANLPEPLVEAPREPLRAGDAEELEQFHAWLRGLKT